jgi:adenylate kinase
MRIVLLGPPGAGKGSVAALIKDRYDLLHISTGDILREEIRKESPLSKEIKSFIERGALVPDEVITKMVDQKLTKDLNAIQGFMLDGYPRNDSQAKELDAILKRIDSSLDFVLNLEATLPLILNRISGRRICKKCGAVYHLTNKPPKSAGVCDVCSGPLYQRSDDNEETIKNRMSVYNISTSPILEYYRQQDKLVTFNGDKETDSLFAEFVKFINENKRFYKNQDVSRN